MMSIPNALSRLLWTHSSSDKTKAKAMHKCSQNNNTVNGLHESSRDKAIPANADDALDSVEQDHAQGCEEEIPE